MSKESRENAVFRREENKIQDKRRGEEKRDGSLILVERSGEKRSEETKRNETRRKEDRTSYANDDN